MPSNFHAVQEMQLQRFWHKMISRSLFSCDDPTSFDSLPFIAYNYVYYVSYTYVIVCPRLNMDKLPYARIFLPAIYVYI